MYLPGWNHDMKAVANEKLTTITKISTTFANDSNVTIPSTNVREGDLLIYHNASGTFVGAQNVHPVGFTELQRRFGSGGFALNFSARIATIDDVGRQLSGMSGGYQQSLLLQFRGNSKFRAFSSAQGSQYQETSANPPSITVPSNSGVAPLIVFGLAWSANSNDGVNFPNSEETYTGTGGNIVLGYDIQNSSPYDTFWDTVDSGTNNHLLGFYINLT